MRPAEVVSRTPYTVYHPLSAETAIEGGVGVSAEQQRRALEAAGVRYTGDRSDPHDVVHLNFPGPSALADLLWAKRRGTPVVVHAHSLGDNVADTHRFSNALAPALARYFAAFYRLADHVVAVSEDTAERLRDRGVTGDISVVSNGVDGAALDGHEDRDAAALRDRYGVDDAAVVNLAQVYEVKGVDDFVATGRRVDADFRWFGARHRWLAPRSTKRLVAGAPPNVRFPGFVADKRDAFALGDVFFFPSYRETQGMALLEAAYCGLPVVVRDVPVFEGWLEHGVHCLKGDGPAEFAAHLRRLLADPELRAELGGNARSLAREHTLDRVGARLRSVYDAALGRNGAGIT